MPQAYPSVEAACDAALHEVENSVKKPVTVASIEPLHESGNVGAICHLEYWQTVPGFAQPVIQKIPVTFVELCSGPAKPSGFCSPQRPSNIVTITITGTVAFGNDMPGIFGKPAANLSGKPFILTYSFDDTKGLMQVVSCVGPSCASRIAAIHQKSSPGTAVLRIGDGPPHSFGIATDGSADSSAQKGILPCCNYGRTYLLGLDVRDSEGSMAITVTNTAEGTPATQDGDWRAPFFDAHVARRVPDRDNAGDLGFGVQKNGRLLSSGALIPETICVSNKGSKCSGDSATHEPPPAPAAYSYSVVVRPGDRIGGRLIGTIWSYALSENGDAAFIATLDTNSADDHHKGLFVAGRLIAEDGKIPGREDGHIYNLLGFGQNGVAYFTAVYLSSQRQPVASILGSDGSVLFASDRPIAGCRPTDPNGVAGAAYGPPSLAFSPVKTDIVFVQANSCFGVYYFTATGRAGVVSVNGTVRGQAQGSVVVRSIADLRYQDRIYYRVLPNASVQDGYIVSEGRILQPTPKIFTAWHVSAKGHVFFETPDGVTRDGALALPHHQTVGGFEILRVAHPVETDAGLHFLGVFGSSAYPDNANGIFTAKGPVLTEGQMFSAAGQTYTVHLGAVGNAPQFFVNNHGQLLSPFGSGLVLASPNNPVAPTQ
jgi:hypothetical protein